MFNIDINEDEEREMMQHAIDERIEELAKEKYFMTYKELADYLNLSKPTIDDLLIKNGMRYYRVGSTYRFKKSDVDGFMDNITSQMDITNNDLKSLKKINNENANDFYICAIYHNYIQHINSRFLHCTGISYICELCMLYVF